MMRARLLILCLLLGFATACARSIANCQVCDREIHARTRAVLTLADGKRVETCCPRCALHYVASSKVAVRGMTVTDYVSGTAVPADRANLVEGSDETPCMPPTPIERDTRAPLQVCYDRCMPSLIAFRDAAAARAFMAEHGGTLH
ncbi:MAG TPA: hypothetical protein VNL37_00480, partial [Candidatus Polarisedimenticolia bacterium]|nr:hypothetical protein [Candidatus Polarisedimenticolia bacterium]